VHNTLVQLAACCWLTPSLLILRWQLQAVQVGFALHYLALHMHLQFNISQIVYLEQCAVLKSDRINDKNAKDIEIAHKYTTKKHNAYKHHLNQPFLPFNTESP
jgi:hypothetical protein